MRDALFGRQAPSAFEVVALLPVALRSRWSQSVCKAVAREIWSVISPMSSRNLSHPSSSAL